MSLVAFIGVHLLAYRVTGAMHSRYMEFEVANIFEEGATAAQLAGQSGVAEVSLCGIDRHADLCDS